MNANAVPRGTGPRHDNRPRAAPLIECIPLPMVELEGRNHVVCFANPAFCHLVQRAHEEVIGKPFAEIVSNGVACGPLLDRAYQAGGFERPAQPATTDPEPTIWVCALWPAPDGHGQPVKVIVQLTKSAVSTRKNMVAMNEALLLGGLRQHELRGAAEKSKARLETEVAERIRVETELRAAKAKLLLHAEDLERAVVERTTKLHAAIGDLEAFSYSLVHDLRGPLRAIQSFTQIVLEMPREEIGASAEVLLRRVVKASSRMDSLIQDVLSLSQVIRRPIVVTAVDVDALVRALVDERPDLSMPRAAVKIEPPLLPMKGHEAMLSQCLNNLLGNAVKFVAPGVVPCVRVRTEILDDPTSEQGSSDQGPGPVPAPQPTVRLWVEDNGIGIDPKAHQTIFEIFQRLHSSAAYEGSGIGLAIVRKAMERMGGRVGVESEVGKGSRFWLELPKG